MRDDRDLADLLESRRPALIRFCQQRGGWLLRFETSGKADAPDAAQLRIQTP